MDIEIKKDLASNWFKLLQNAICDDISRLEKNKIKFKSTSWQRSKKKMREVVNIGLLQMEKFLKK